MPTNEERREVAARLRNEKYSPWDDMLCEIAQCVGIPCCNSECHGSDETPECAENLAKTLAGLIDPEPEQVCFVTNCDRGEVLDVVDDIRDRARLNDDAGNDGEAFYLFGIARRLEEACGVCPCEDEL